MAYGLVDQPGAEELEKFADYLLAGWEIHDKYDGEELDDDEIDAEISQRISEYLRHGNC